MRKILSIAIVAATLAGVCFARVGEADGRSQTDGEARVRAAQAQSPAATGGAKKIVHTKSNLMAPIAPGDSAVYLVGDVAAQHNGAVITCDSAVRYSDMHIQFFGNVLINKNTTYVYGDRAEYDGTKNEARIYSDLIKVIDGDASLYTYRFSFDTKENIGEFADGGVMINRENRLEAVRGYYYADTKRFVCVDRVEMRNDEYELRGDSVVYDMQTDNARFFDRTNIWDRDGNYLYADRGEYRKTDSLYIVTRNGYILTEKQEMWSDSIDFYRNENHAILRHDLQLDDTEHKTIAFGDYGEYWKNPGNAFLTRRPSVLNYDLSQGPDTLYVRADSMYLFTVLPGQRIDSLETETGPAEEIVAPDEERRRTEPTENGDPRPSRDSLRQRPMPKSDSLTTAGTPVDSLSRQEAADSLAAPTNPLDTLTGDARKAYLKELDRQAKAEKKAAAAAARKERLSQIAAQRKEKMRAKLEAQQKREEEREAARKAKALSRLEARRARAARKGRPLPVDSVLMRLTPPADSLAKPSPDSLTLDSITRDSLSAAAPAPDSLETKADTLRLLKGFRNVRIYRTDFQSVCDSMTAISSDSTLHLYIDPVLWNESNQISSDVMDIYTRRQQLERAEFIGSPMMVAELDSLHYNQIAGKQMTAFFRDNDIYRNDVNGNVQTLYFLQDGEPPVITALAAIESGDASFFIEEKQIAFIVYRINPEWPIYPIDQIPEEQPLYLEGFKWQGARRPARKEDVFDRKLRPSEREARSQLLHPQFPIMQRIDDHKRELIEQRRWFDRSEQVDPATVEWMRDLGYEVGQPRQ